MRLSRHGIRLDADGRGISYYQFRKPKHFYNGPSEISREDTIVATYAGLIAQQKFYPECSVLGASDDNGFIDLLIQEISAEDDFIGSATLAAQVKLRRKSQSLVDAHWLAIVAVAQALWELPFTLRDSNEPEPTWSALTVEKKLDGARIVEILRPFQIQVSIWDDLDGDTLHSPEK